MPPLLHTWAEEQERRGHPRGAHSGCFGCWAGPNTMDAKVLILSTPKELSPFLGPSRAIPAEDYCQER